MRMKMIVLMGLTLILVAQAGAGVAMFGPQVGAYRAGDADNWSFMGGLDYRVKFSPVIGAEASVNYRQESYLNDAVTIRSWPVMVTGLLYPIPFLYGAIGAGWYNTTYDYNQDMLPSLTDENTQEFGWHFGGGVELPMGPTVKLVGDIRYVFLNYDFKNVPGSGDPKSDFAIITVGFLFDL